MSKLTRLLLILGLSLGLAGASPALAQTPAATTSTANRAPRGFDPEAEKIAQSIEQKIMRNVQGFLGADIPIMIQVEMLPIDAPIAAEDDEGRANPDDVDLGYVESMPALSSNGSHNPGDTPKFGGVRVHVGLPQSLSPEQIEGVKNLVRASAKSLRPKIRIVALNKVVTPKPQTEAERTLASEPPPSTLDKLLAKYAAIFPLLGAIMVGAGLVFGAWLLFSSVKQIARGIQDFRFPNISGNPDKPVVVEHKNGQEAPARPRTPPPPSDRSRAALRNLKTVRAELTRNPMSLLRCLSESEDDLFGVRWLLPQLSDSEQEATKALLGPDRLSKIGALPKEAGENWDTLAWLENLVQTLTFKRLSIRSALETALPKEELIRLAKLPPQRLQNAVPKDDVLSLRIALEVLPSERSLELLRQSSDKLWEGLIQQAWPAPDDLRSAATRLLEAAGQDEASLPEQNSGRAEFFSQVLLEPTLALLAEKGPGEDDAFLDSLTRKDKAFAELVRRRFWTPSILSRVADEVLRAAVAALTPAAKSALLVVLPATLNERVAALLPAGMGKTIAIDQARKIRERADAQELASCRAELRNFLNELKAAADRGEFELAPVAGTPPSEATREAA